MNKFISSFAAIALVITSVVISPVQAAGIPDANITLTYTVVGVNSDTLAITLASNVVATNGDAVTATVRNAATGALVNLSTNGVANTTNVSGAANGGANGQITYVVTDKTLASTVTMTFTAGNLATANYTVTIVSGVAFGVKVFSVGGANQVSVSATVDPILTFALGSNTIALGTLSSSAATSASHTMTAASNATSGYVVTVSGATLTSGANTIDAYTAGGAASVPGTEGFGINLKDNATPNVGAEVSGSGTGVAVGNFAIADTFAFNASGANTIANSASAPSGSSVFTVSYVANISASTAAGTYGTTLTYTATPTF